MPLGLYQGGPGPGHPLPPLATLWTQVPPLLHHVLPCFCSLQSSLLYCPLSPSSLAPLLLLLAPSHCTASFPTPASSTSPLHCVLPFHTSTAHCSWCPTTALHCAPRRPDSPVASCQRASLLYHTTQPPGLHASLALKAEPCCTVLPLGAEAGAGRGSLQPLAAAAARAKVGSGGWMGAWGLHVAHRPPVGKSCCRASQCSRSTNSVFYETGVYCRY